MPTNYGCEECEGKLTFRWFSGNQLPDAYEDIIMNKEPDFENESGIHMIFVNNLLSNKQNFHF